jgi:hypothetical protein
MPLRNSDGHALTSCPECDGRGWYCLWGYGDELGGDLCDRCGGSGVTRAFALIPIYGASGNHLLTAKYVADMYHAAMCSLDGWPACVDYGDLYQVRGFPVQPGYADIRDFLLYYDTDYFVACQVALHVTRPNECFWLRLPVLF